MYNDITQDIEEVEEVSPFHIEVAEPFQVGDKLSGIVY
jgi:hypothetical protein